MTNHSASMPHPSPRRPAPSPPTKTQSLPTLRHTSSPQQQQQQQHQQQITAITKTAATVPDATMGKQSAENIVSSRRPSTPRAQTDPQPSTMTSLPFMSSLSTPTTKPRNRSPYARSHLRSHSGSALPNAPPMTRAHSLPTVMQPIGNLKFSSSPMPLACPASPLRSPKLSRSPRALEPRPHPERYGSGNRPASIGSFDGAPSVCDISEDAELELTPRVGTTVSSLYSSTGSLSRRRRPASPLYQVSVSFGTPPTSNPSGSQPTSTASSPLFAPARFNENYPSSLASSSVPSTPTSMRSRSPSISSLETIEDSPDAEEEAIEADRIRKLKAAADREDGGEGRRSSLDVPEGRGRSLGFGKRDSRKRWSVCGAERRQDLDLETIWED
ncbi:hypothetical protein PTMSG1_04658 [Pyrenophora teres f. maculata]|nr:hypothetical protein PTMSG1_04658 [Pyrenophora teres f. maculata]